MTDKDEMREAIIKFGQDNPSLDLDFRLHTHGRYLTQEKAIVASRAFKAGAAWQAAKSVPVVGEPVAWGVTKRYEDNVWFISDSRFTAQHYANQYAHRIGDKPDQVVVPLYSAPPTTSTTEAELERLRKDAERYRWLRDNKSHTFSVSRDDLQKPNYMTAEDFINDDPLNDFKEFGDTEELKRMSESDTIWRLQVYPDTPIGFCVWHGASLDYVVDAAIDAAIAGEKGEKK